MAKRMSAGPVHPSPLSPDPGLKSQPPAASAPSYLSAVYCLFHSAISPKLGPHLPSRLMKMGFYWSGSPTSAFIKDMSGPGGWGGGSYCSFICCTDRGMGCPFTRYRFQLKHSCHQPGAPLFHGTVWEKVTSPPRSRFVQLKGFEPNTAPKIRASRLV